MGYCIFLRKGETHTVPIAGTKASDLAIGSIVKLNENGVYTDFIVVNQGIPENSNLYDSSCDGVWLLRKDLLQTQRGWNSTNSNIYHTSTLSTWLNNEYVNILGSTEQKIIKQVKIPYCIGNASSTINSGSNGLSIKIFLLGGYELGFAINDYSYFPVDGAKLDYFEIGSTTSANNKRVASYNNLESAWWSRSAVTNNIQNAFLIARDGTYGIDNASAGRYIRPALIIPSTAKFDTDMKLIG